jgi:short-subunit dehydrogenase
MPTLAGRVVVLTGASSGIGRAVALELAPRGVRLVLAARDEAALLAVAGECARLGSPDVLVVPTDVVDQAACFALVDRVVERYGALDVLVHNAGITMWSRFDEVQDLEIYERLIRVNYLACVWLTHRALPHLVRSRGLIAVIASVAGLTGVPTRTGYAASKHAVIGFFESLRIELRGSGVGVTIVAPDFVRSEIHRRALGPDGRPLGRSPLVERRIMSAEQCARRIARAIERRRRLTITSTRGRWGRWLRLAAPGVVDSIAARAIRTGR